MKVNIVGKRNGELLPGVGLLPVYGADLTDQEILRVLNFNGVRVFDASSGGQITKKALLVQKKKPQKTISKPVAKPDVIPVKTPVDTPIKVADPAELTIESSETDVADTSPTEEITAPVEETSTSEDDSEDTETENVVVEESVESTEDVTEEASPVEEKPYHNNYYSGKKKNKKR